MKIKIDKNIFIYFLLFLIMILSMLIISKKEIHDIIYNDSTMVRYIDSIIYDTAAIDEFIIY